MKKIIAILLVVIMITGLTACGNNNPASTDLEDTTSESEQSSTNQTENNNDDPIVSSSISIEDVMNAKESPEKDFEIVDYGDGIVEITKYLGDDVIVVIPATVNGKAITRIGAYVFANNYHPNTKAVRLSDSVKVVDTGAFGLNNSLEIFIAGSDLEEIGEGAFQNCVNLREVVLNDGLLRLASACFSECTSLLSIEIPDSVSEIHMLAFYPCAEGFTIIGSNNSAAADHAASEGITFQSK